MSHAVAPLVHYAAYHRDRRNIATHFVGVPMIVLAVTAWLARVQWPALGPLGSLATVASAVVVLYYLALDRRLGLAMAVFNGLAWMGGTWLAAQPWASWLGGSVALFVVGWAFQFLGHLLEGRKPAFVDDLRGLLIGPLFIVAEVLFALGLCRDLHSAIERHAGAPRPASVHRSAA
ncbi:DUF962 domain-containing protein [Eleftheria terrae]|uniref:Mpo1 family 2-hydroxy fatty acid dioxygenase n=1 Tax=Eleftheria terrae TaxID=1597781 RepID=UPI00263A441D|nr:Mpo1-like protein [Eleftheria terrae]WKB53404.1 DUF962 domain-containing protein [Eleftheria terrae]